MMTTNAKRNLLVRSLLVTLAFLMCAESSWAILGVWRRTAVRTTAVVAATTTTAAAASASAAASQEAAAAQQQQAVAAQQQAEAAQEQAAVAQEQAAAATATKSPQQKLEELQGLYKQGLINESDYQAAKAKILAQMTN